MYFFADTVTKEHTRAILYIRYISRIACVFQVEKTNWSAAVTGTSKCEHSWDMSTSAQDHTGVLGSYQSDSSHRPTFSCWLSRLMMPRSKHFFSLSRSYSFRLIALVCPQCSLSHVLCNICPKRAFCPIFNFLQFRFSSLLPIFFHLHFHVIFGRLCLSAPDASPF